MGMTIGEKIIARAAGVPCVKPGEIHTVDVDYLMSNDLLSMDFHKQGMSSA